MLWRVMPPSGHQDTLLSLAAILLTVWLLGAIGAYEADSVALFALVAATVVVTVAVFRRVRS